MRPILFSRHFFGYQRPGSFADDLHRVRPSLVIDYLHNGVRVVEVELMKFGFGYFFHAAVC